MTESKTKKWLPLLWVLLPLLFVLILFARAVRPDDLVLPGALGFLLLGNLVALVLVYRRRIHVRTMTYGANWIITLLLTFAIVGVVNYFAFRNPKKFDVTKSKVNSLNEQTVKILRSIKDPIFFTYFARTEEQESKRQFFNNLRSVNPRIEVERLDPLKDGVRGKALGIRNENVLIVKVAEKEARIEGLVEEEKVTNTLIGLVQGKPPTLCSITSHGEKDFNSSQPDGFMEMKRILQQLNYQFQELNLVSEGKIPEVCSAVTILGAKSTFFDPEIVLLRNYFNAGGRLLITLDVNIRDGEVTPQLHALLKEWGVESTNALIMDPASARNNYPVDVVQISSLNDHPITDDLKNARQSFFAITTRPIRLVNPTPAGLKAEWLGQANASAFAKTNFSDLTKSEVKLSPGDIPGVQTVAVAVSGKTNPAAKAESRLVVIGTTMFAANNFAAAGRNKDFFANSVSWLLQNENLISIRPRDEDSGRFEMSDIVRNLIMLVSVIVVPFLVLLSGIWVWIRRRRL